MREYEIGIVFRPDLTEERLNTECTKYEAIMQTDGGQILKKDPWGSRKLAYPIKKYSKGNYFFYNVANPGQFVAELERNFRISDGVLRYLTIKLSEKVDIEKRKIELAKGISEEDQIDVEELEDLVSNDDE